MPFTVPEDELDTEFTVPADEQEGFTVPDDELDVVAEAPIQEPVPQKNWLQKGVEFAARNDLLLPGSSQIMHGVDALRAAKAKEAEALAKGDNSPIQPLLETALYSIPKSTSDTVTGMVGGAARALDKGAEIVAKYTGAEKSGFFGGVADAMKGAEEYAAEDYPVDPRNPITSTIFGGAAQGATQLALGMGGKVLGLGDKAVQTIPLAVGALLGTDQGIKEAERLGVEGPELQLAMGALFGTAEVLTEKIGGIGGKKATAEMLDKYKVPAKEMLKRMMKIIAVEGLVEEPAAGIAQDTIAWAFANEDPENPGFTTTGVELPVALPQTKEQLIEWAKKRGMEALGGAAGGTVFAGAQALANAGKEVAPPPLPDATTPVDPTQPPPLPDPEDAAVAAEIEALAADEPILPEGLETVENQELVEAPPNPWREQLNKLDELQTLKDEAETRVKEAFAATGVADDVLEAQAEEARKLLNQHRTQLHGAQATLQASVDPATTASALPDIQAVTQVVGEIVQGSTTEQDWNALTAEESAMQGDTRDEEELSNDEYSAKARGKNKQKRAAVTAKHAEFLAGIGVDMSGLPINDHITSVIEQGDGSFEVRIEHHDKDIYKPELVRVRRGDKITNPGKMSFVNGVGTVVTYPTSTTEQEPGIADPRQDAPKSPDEQQTPVDELYNKAVESGDKISRKELFESEANKRGFVKVYMGVTGGSVKGNQFDPKYLGVTGSDASKKGYFFTTKKSVADGYARVGKGKTLEFYIHPGESQTVEGTNNLYTTEVDPIFKSGKNSIFYKGVDDVHGLADNYMIAIGSENRIKSANDLEVDDAGNTIPLSARFSLETKDIRGRTQSQTEQPTTQPTPADTVRSQLGHEGNQRHYDSYLESVKRWARRNPAKAAIILENSDVIRVNVVGGTTDPARNNERRGDIDLVFDDNLADPEVFSAVSDLQTGTVSPEHQPMMANLDVNAAAGRSDASDTRVDTHAAIMEALANPNPSHQPTPANAPSPNATPTQPTTAKSPPLPPPQAEVSLPPEPELLPAPSEQPVAQVEGEVIEVFHGTETEPGKGQKSGYYPGTYAATNPESTKQYGGRQFTAKVNRSKIYQTENLDSLKDEAEKAGFGRHSANGQAEAAYLKSLGYEGMNFGEGVILFDNAKPQWSKAAEAAKPKQQKVAKKDLPTSQQQASGGGMSTTTQADDILAKAAEIGELQAKVKERAQIFNAGAKEDAANLIGMNPEEFYNLPYEKWSEVDKTVQAFRQEAEDAWKGSDKTLFSEIWSRYAKENPKKVDAVRKEVESKLQPPTQETRHPNLTPRARTYLIAMEDGQGRVSTRSEQRAIADENGFTFKDGDSESFENALKARAAELAAGPIGPMIDLSEPPTPQPTDTKKQEPVVAGERDASKAESIMGEVTLDKDWTSLTEQEGPPPLGNDFTGYGQWKRDVAKKLLPNGTNIQQEALAMEIGDKITSENSRPEIESWQHHIVARNIASQLLTGVRKDVFVKAKKRALSNEYSQWYMGGIFENQPISVEAYDANDKRPLPEGYTKKGDLYVHSTPQPAEKPVAGEGAVKKPRTYLNVPFASKDSAKTLGAKWDAEEKLWYVEHRDDGSIPSVPDRWALDEGVALRDKGALKAAQINAEQKYGRPVEIAPFDMVSGTAYALRFTGGNWLNENVSREEARATKATSSEKAEPAKPDSSAAFEIIKNAYPFKTTQTPSEERAFLHKVKTRLKPLGIAGWKIDSAVESIKLRRAQSGGGKLFYVDPSALHAELLRNGDVATAAQQEPSIKAQEEVKASTLKTGDEFSIGKDSYKVKSIRRDGAVTAEFVSGPAYDAVTKVKKPAGTPPPTTTIPRNRNVTIKKPKTPPPDSSPSRKAESGAISASQPTSSPAPKESASPAPKVGKTENTKKQEEATKKEVVDPINELVQSEGVEWRLQGNKVVKAGFGHWTPEEMAGVRQQFKAAGLSTSAMNMQGGKLTSSFVLADNDDGFDRVSAAIQKKDIAQRDAEKKAKVDAEAAKQAEELAAVDPNVQAWMADTFDRSDFANPYNKVQLSSFLTGKSNKFAGLVNPRWLAGVTKAGAVGEGGVVNFAKLKENFQAWKKSNENLSQQAESNKQEESVTKIPQQEEPSKPPDQKKAGTERLSDKEFIALVKKSESGSEEALEELYQSRNTDERVTVPLLEQVDAKYQKYLKAESSTPKTIKQGDSVSFKQEGALHKGTYVGVNPDGTHSVQVKGEKVARHVSARSINDSNSGRVVEGTKFSLDVSQRSMPKTQAQEALDKMGIPRSKVYVLNEPSLVWRGRYDPSGQIGVNVAYIGSVEELVDTVLGHEAVHDAVESDPKVKAAAENLRSVLTKDELQDIEAEIANYEEYQKPDERLVEYVRKLTESRPELATAWGRFVEAVMLAIKKFLRISNLQRRQAELMAARILARGTKRVMQGKTGGRDKLGGNMYADPVTPDMDAAYSAAIASGDMAKVQELVDLAARKAIKSNPRLAVEHGALLTKEEYQDAIDKIKPLSKRVFYVGNIEVIRNPSGDDLRGMNAEVKAKYGRDVLNDPATRFTHDKFGNTWRWKSYEATHYQMEPAIVREEGVNVNQNNQIEDHWSIVKDAVRAGTYIPPNVQAENERYKDFIKPSSADPITYDSSGQIIPLSQRFNPASPDIRYGKEPTTQDEGGQGAAPLSPTDNSQRAQAVRAAASGIDWGTASPSEKKKAVDAFGRERFRSLHLGNLHPDARIIISSGNSQRPNARFDGIHNGQAVVVVDIGFGRAPFFKEAEQAMAYAYDSAQEEMIHALQFLAEYRRWVKAGSNGDIYEFIDQEARDALSEIGDVRAKGEASLIAKIDAAFINSWNSYSDPQNLDSFDAIIAKLNSGSGLTHAQFYAELVRQLTQINRGDFTTETGWRTFGRKVSEFIQKIINSLKEALGLAKGGQLGPTIQREIADLEKLMDEFKAGDVTPRALYALPKGEKQTTVENRTIIDETGKRAKNKEPVAGKPAYVSKAEQISSAKQWFKEAGIEVTKLPMGDFKVVRATTQAINKLHSILKREIIDLLPKGEWSRLGVLQKSIRNPNFIRQVRNDVDMESYIELKKTATGHVSHLGGALAANSSNGAPINYGDVADDLKDSVLSLAWMRFNGVEIDRLISEVDDEVEGEVKPIVGGYTGTVTGGKIAGGIDKLVEKEASTHGGGKVFRAIQGTFNPKNPRSQELKEAQDEINEIITQFLEKLKAAGIEPPNKKPDPNLSPLEKLNLFTTPEGQEAIRNFAEDAITEARYKAGWSYVLESADTEEQRNEARANLEMPWDKGPMPQQGDIDAGLESESLKFKHWKAVQETWTKYDPVTTKLVGDILKDDFKGLTPEKAAAAKKIDSRINIKELAKAPEAEKKRVLDALVEKANLAMDENLDSEARTRISEQITNQFLTQLAAAQKSVIDGFLNPADSNVKPKTSAERMAGLLNSGLEGTFGWERIQKVINLLNSIINEGKYYSSAAVRDMAVKSRDEKVKWVNDMVEGIVGENPEIFEGRQDLQDLVRTRVLMDLGAAERVLAESFLKGEPPNPVERTATQKLDAEQKSKEAAVAKLQAGLNVGMLRTLPVGKLASRSAVRGVMPKMKDLIETVLKTPQKDQAALATAFTDALMTKLGINPAIADKTGKVLAKAFHTKMMTARQKALAKVGKSLIKTNKVIKPGTPVWVIMERLANTGGLDSTSVIEEVAKANGYKMPTAEQVAKMKALSEEEQSLRLPTEGDSPKMTEGLKSQQNFERRTKIIKEMKAIWSSFANTTNLKTIKGWQNVNRAIGEMASAILLGKASFLTKQVIDIGFAHFFVNSPTRAIVDARAASKSYSDSDGFTAELFNSLQSAAKAQLSAIRTAAEEARLALKGSSQRDQVLGLENNVLIYERMVNKANELWEKGGNVNKAQAILIHITASPRVMYRVSMAMDNFQGALREAQLMRSQIANHYRLEGLTMEQAEKAADKMLDAKANMADLLTLLPPDMPHKEAVQKAIKMLPEYIYGKMEKAGMMLEGNEGEQTLQDLNQKERNTYGWNEQVEGGPGWYVGQGVKLVGDFGVQIPVLGIPAVVASRFHNAIATGINRAATFAGFGLFPDLMEGDPFYATEKLRQERRAEAIAGLTALGPLLALALAGVLKVFVKWPTDEKEKDKWAAMNRRSGTVEITLSGETFRMSMNTGPLSYLRTALGGIGGAQRYMEALEKENAERKEKGIKAKEFDVSDLAGSAALWAGLTGFGGGRTTAGLMDSKTDYSELNAKKATATTVSALIPWIPAYNEVMRLSGYEVDPKNARVEQMIFVIPGSGAERINGWGKPVNHNLSVTAQSVMTGGTVLQPLPQGKELPGWVQILQKTDFRPSSFSTETSYMKGGRLVRLSADERNAIERKKAVLFGREVDKLSPSLPKTVLLSRLAEMDNAAKEKALMGMRLSRKD